MCGVHPSLSPQKQTTQAGKVHLFQMFGDLVFQFMFGLSVAFIVGCGAFLAPAPNCHDTTLLCRRYPSRVPALSSDYLENDLVAIRSPTPNNGEDDSRKPSRLCVVRFDGSVLPLCVHEDDVPTDLFSDPRACDDKYWQEVTDSDIKGTYGEGWYGQRPVPSLGGGPGYGAEADEIWSIDEELERDGVEVPVLDAGISHGEKARGGAL